MSRLDSFIRRLEAQRACLDHAVGLVRDVPGVILELGLGQARTFDHLARLAPEREIFVFDRQVDVPDDWRPDPAHLILGDIAATLPRARDRFAAGVCLVHSDIGTGDAHLNALIADFLATTLPPMLGSGAVIVSDQPLAMTGTTPLAPPPGVKPGRYSLYRNAPAVTPGRG